MSADWFWSKVAVGEPDDCWEWQAYRKPNGYGQATTLESTKGQTSAHRVAYELVKGPIPEGFVVDHLCENRPCVNPAHLEAVTNAVNIKRGFAKKPPRPCPGNHPLSTRQVILGVRRCSICYAIGQRAKAKRRYWRQRGVEI